jgi:hypothetical protein
MTFLRNEATTISHALRDPFMPTYIRWPQLYYAYFRPANIDVMLGISHEVKQLLSK